MAEIKIGAIVELRGSPDDWRLINTMFDGHVHKFVIQSMFTGEVKSVFKNEIFDKSSSTYKEINDFFNNQALTDLLFDDSFELYTEEVPIETVAAGYTPISTTAQELEEVPIAEPVKKDLKLLHWRKLTKLELSLNVINTPTSLLRK
jgi:uncharacterized protein YozE (UPF0346 family)